MAITPNTPNPVREDAYKTELATKLGIDPQYIPSSPVWRNEEEIAAIAEMFSNMTAGSSGGVLVVTDTSGTLDKTWQEINDAPIAYIHTGNFRLVPYQIRNNKGQYQVNASYAASASANTLLQWNADSASGYPVLVE